MEFRRLTDPILVPIGLVASWVQVGLDFGMDDANENFTHFQVVNAFPVHGRLSGFKSYTGARAVEWKGWLFKPGAWGVFRTQQPLFMSGLAVARPNYPIADGNGQALYPDAVLEMSYGRVV